jgi:hypothetical protein
MTKLSAARSRPPSREAQLEGMPDAFVDCRAHGHWWKVTHRWGAKVASLEGPVDVHNFSTEVKVCKRNPKDPCKDTVIYDADLAVYSRVSYRPRGYNVTGQGRTHYRREAKREWLRRTAK